MTAQQETSKTEASRRQFLKGAVAAVYVTPLVVSMPVRASKAGYGSGKTDKESEHNNERDKDKHQHQVKYEPKNCPDPVNKEGRVNTFKKYTQSPYTPSKQLSQSPMNYQFQGNFKSHSKQ